jgi:hypothetical protein
MWICFNDAFVSAVRDKVDPTKLVVRARAKEHLTRLFGEDAVISRSFRNDYEWRTWVTPEEFARVVADRVEDISYDNFKDSVRDEDLKSMYTGWWYDHWSLQNERRLRAPVARPSDPKWLVYRKKKKHRHY